MENTYGLVSDVSTSTAVSSCSSVNSDLAGLRSLKVLEVVGVLSEMGRVVSSEIGLTWLFFELVVDFVSFSSVL